MGARRLAGESACPTWDRRFRLSTGLFTHLSGLTNLEVRVLLESGIYRVNLSKSDKFACPARLTAGGSDTFPLLELDAAGFDGARGGAIEVGQGFGEIGMGADFAIARGDQEGLPADSYTHLTLTKHQE